MGRSKFFLALYAEKNNCGQYRNGKHILYVKQISDNLQSVGDQTHLVGYMRLPITAPWFWQFSNCLEKLETFYRSTLLFYIQHNKVHSFQFFSGWATIIFSLGTSLKDRLSNSLFSEYLSNPKLRIWVVSQNYIIKTILKKNWNRSKFNWNRLNHLILHQCSYSKFLNR